MSVSPASPTGGCPPRCAASPPHPEPGSRGRWLPTPGPWCSPGTPFLGEQRVRTHPVGVLVGDRGNDELVGAGRVAEPLQVIGDLGRGTDELGLYPVGDQCPVGVG